MSNASLVIGGSGTGKSSAIRHLDPKETFIINVLDKPLPFKGHKKNYKPLTAWTDEVGNYYASDNWVKILKCIQIIDNERPDIKVIVLDDMQYIMSNEYIRRATETGYGKFIEIAQHMWSIINALTATREGLYCFVSCHNDIDMQGKSKCKTIGKMLEEKITLEGMFTNVFHSMVLDGEFKFLTQNDGIHTAKTPLGMFNDKYIDNDYQMILNVMRDYE